MEVPAGRVLLVVGLPSNQKLPTPHFHLQIQLVGKDQKASRPTLMGARRLLALTMHTLLIKGNRNYEELWDHLKAIVLPLGSV